MGGFVTMNETVPFPVLRQLLTQLGFTQAIVSGSHVSFEHAPTRTILVYREYSEGESVTAGDLAKTRKFLDERGLLARHEFESRMHAPDSP
jgi:predicted RNA binding protein YcfA (HicA-like mRNA interferase family)